MLASETGVLEATEDQIVAKGRLRPGKLFLVDLERDRIVPDDEVKADLARRRPYGEWLHDRVVHIEDLPEKSPRVPRVEPLRAKQLAFGWTEEDLKVILAPMARDAAEPTGSMGNDVALAEPVRPPPAAVLLLQAAVRAGHQPGDRPDPRVGGDEPRRPASAPRSTCSARRPTTATSS